MHAPSGTVALRGPALTFHDDPFRVGGEASHHHEPDALVLMHDGHITQFGDWSALQHTLPEGTPVHHYPASHLILPGFIDTHVHYPQTQIIGAYGTQLIDWLNDYTFVAEQQFAHPEHAREVARLFLQEAVRAGTTTAMVYCTVHPESVDAFFEVAASIDARMIAGKVLMDRHAPAPLLDTAQRGYDESKALIQRWHGHQRLLYSLTPRFAPTSTHAQLDLTGALWREFPQVYLQSHISENLDEVAWAKALFPERSGYLDIYDHHGLLGPRAVYGHGIHLTPEELQRLHESGTAVAHCPTSNLFLGSGFLDVAGLQRADRPVLTGLATDVGGGTSLSMLQTMNEAYKVAQVNGHALSAWEAFYLATRGGAKALGLQDTIGTLAPGFEADLVVLDLKSTPLIDFRMKRCASLKEALFVQMIMGDDRAVRATWIAGREVYDRDRALPHTF